MGNENIWTLLGKSLPPMWFTSQHLEARLPYPFTPFLFPLTLNLSPHFLQSPTTTQVVYLVGHLHITIKLTTLKPKPKTPPTTPSIQHNSTQQPTIHSFIPFMALITSQPKNPILHHCSTLHRPIPRLNTTVFGLGSFSHNAKDIKNFNFNPKQSKIPPKNNPYTYNLAVTAKANASAAFGESLEGPLKHRKILLSEVEVKRERRVFFGRKWNSLDIGTAGIVLAMHVLCLFAPFHFNWPAFWVAMALYVVTGLFGITLSFHRNLSHRSFKVPKWLEYLFAYCGVLALQVDFDSLTLFYFILFYFCLFIDALVFWFCCLLWWCRGIQLIGWAHIGIITSFVILRETLIAPLKDSGSAIWVGSLILILW